MYYFSQLFFGKKGVIWPSHFQWDGKLLGMRWLMIIMLVVAWGCGKSPDTELPPKVTFDAPKAARAELRVLEEPGLWKQDNTVVVLNTQTNLEQTNRFTATTQVSWALKGNLLLLETEINSERKGYELVVKNFAGIVATNQYRCTWFHNDGLVRGYAGQWRPKQARMDWFPLYLPGAPKGFDIQMAESLTGPREKQFSYQITEKGEVTSSGLFNARHVGDYARSEGSLTPASKELERLGRVGIWKETQTVSEAGATTKSLEMLSRMRWARGGKFLINEGVVDPEGNPEYFMWVKTWDSVSGVYRWAYFFHNGTINHFTGYWDSAKQLITWHCELPGLVIALRERLHGPEKRSWTFEMQNTTGIIATGSGGSQFQGKAE